MSFVDQFLWIIYPYLVVAIFVLGLLLRYRDCNLSKTAGLGNLCSYAVLLQSVSMAFLLSGLFYRLSKNHEGSII